MSRNAARAEPLSSATLLAYGLPGLPLAVLSLPLFVYLPAFYAEDVGVGFAAVGAALLVARVWDVVTDPLIGTLSDRFDTRWGRRRPWLVAGTPLAMVSAWFLFHPPAEAGWSYLLLWTLLLYLAGTMVMLPYHAWGAELSPDYHARSRISAYREAFVVVGILTATGLPALLRADKAEALSVLALLLILTLPLAVAITCRAVPDAPARPSPAADWRRSLKVLRANGPFQRLIAAYFLNGIANGLPATLFLLFVEKVLKAPEWSGPLLFVYFLCGVAAVPLWLRLSYRYGKHRVWAAAMIATCLVFIWVPLLGPGDVAWFAVVCVLTGLGLGADLVLPPAMQADVVDYDTLKSRRRRAGVYFGLWGMATKLALALAVGLSFPILELIGLGSQSSGAGSAGGLFVLAALYSLAPVAFKLLAIALIWGFPLSHARQARIRRLIEARQGS